MGSSARSPPGLDGDSTKFKPLIESNPSAGSDNYRGYDHSTWYVGNARQAASWYITRMGFRLVAYRGLQTGSRAVASYVVTNGLVRFVLTTPIRPLINLECDVPPSERKYVAEIHAHLAKHGDAVKDIAFEVDDARAVYANAVANGAKGVQETVSLEDNDGQISFATIKAYGDTTHTFIERRNYRGVFLPGYRLMTKEDPIAKLLPEIRLDVIDHFVGNQDWNEMESVCTL
jgi:4-hydroxyphenylpyruvate dioxygenase